MKFDCVDTKQKHKRATHDDGKKMKSAVNSSNIYKHSMYRQWGES